jgi:arylsulfatase A-like enzyme
MISTSLGTTVYADSPNFILMIGDDMGIETLACHQIGTATAHTPNLDELCADGMRFDNFWTQPVCSPTRAQLLTGQFGFRNGVGTPVNGPTGIEWAIPSENDGLAAAGGMGAGNAMGMGGMAMGAMGMGAEVTPGQTTPGGNRPSISPDAFTFLNALKKDTEKNYSTAALGKWHLANDANGGLKHPKRVGFDHYSGSMRAGGPNSYYAWSKVVDAGDPYLETNYATTDNVDDGIAWITQRQDEPWFLWAAFNAPHNPLELPPVELVSSKASLALYENANQANDSHAIFNAMVEAMDTEIGRLLGSLDKRTRDNTYVIFMGDNGTSGAAVRPPFPNGRAKGTVFEGGARVPFIISGPGIKAGSVNNAMTNSADIYATVLELAGIDINTVIPKDLILDSVSMVPLLSETKTMTRDFNYADHFGSTRNGEADERAIRNHSYKLVQDFGNNFEGFYNLNNDPYESNNLLESTMEPEAQENYNELLAKINRLAGPK